MKEIVIRIETDHNHGFVLIQEIRFNGETIHENILLFTELYANDKKEWMLERLIREIHDKEIYYKYISKCKEFDCTKQVKRKIDRMINEYKYNVELTALKEKYGIK